MSDYLIIESGESMQPGAPWPAHEIAVTLASAGNAVTLFLVQNGVLAARRGARFGTPGSNASVTLLADDFSLRERGIPNDTLATGVSPSPLETVIDALAAGARVIWQ